MPRGNAQRELDNAPAPALTGTPRLVLARAPTDRAASASVPNSRPPPRRMRARMHRFRSSRSRLPGSAGGNLPMRASVSAIMLSSASRNVRRCSGLDRLPGCRARQVADGDRCLSAYRATPCRRSLSSGQPMNVSGELHEPQETRDVLVACDEGWSVMRREPLLDCVDQSINRGSR